MATRVNNFQTAAVTLAADVAQSATITVPYPAGTTSGSYIASGHLGIVNGNNQFNAGDPGFLFTFGASDISVINKTGATLPIGTRITFQFEQADGNAPLCLTLPLPAFSLLANGNVLTDLRPTIAGAIEAWDLVVMQPVTTAGKTATLNLKIGTTNVAGTTIALASAAATPMGKVLSGSPITGANRLAFDSKLSVVASSVTAFVEGTGYLVLYIRPDVDATN